MEKPEVLSLELKDIKIKTTATTAIIQATFEYPGEISDYGIYASVSNDYNNGTKYDTEYKNSIVKAVLTDLEQNTTYYYWFDFNNGYGQHQSAIYSFKTTAKSLAE